LAAEIAQLRDLFRRRLYDDRRRGQLYDALEEQSRKLSAVLTNRALADVFLEVLLSVDLLLDDRLTLAVARDAGEQILEAFARRGFAQVATSPVFDPATQEAVDKVAATPELPPGAVVQVVRPGFRLQDKLLRPAQVIVAVQE
jgi:molecular chaperone GrpE